MKLKDFKSEIIAAGVLIFILAYTLMLRPVIGVADNGDFPRIMGSTGLEYMDAAYEERYFGYVNRLYRIGIPIPFGGGYFSTEIPVVVLAVLLSQAAVPSGFFDIRFLSLIYSCIYIFSIFLLLKYGRQKPGIPGWALSVLYILIFADAGYITYFNSLYGEAVTLVFLMLMAGTGVLMASGAKPPYWALAAFFTGLIFFAGAKVQNSPAGILAVLLGLRLMRCRRDKAWKRLIVIGSAVVLAVSVLSFVTISRDIKICNKYQTVFYGILKDSPDPAGDLEELGLDPGYAVLAGTNYFMKEYPLDIRSDTFKNEIYNNINHFKIAGFYLKHPGRFLKKLEIAADNAFKLKQGFGNYEKYPGIEYKATFDMFSFWSSFKMTVLPHSLGFLVVFFLLFICTLILLYIKSSDPGWRFLMELMAVISVIGAVQLVVPVIGDGEADLSKHLFLFNICFDLMFIAGAAYTISLFQKVARFAYKLLCRSVSKRIKPA